MLASFSSQHLESETLSSRQENSDSISTHPALGAHERAPEADAIVQTGAGFRMLQVVDAIEGRTGTPLVASDFALYWAMLKHLKLPAAPGYGHLLSTLS